MLEHYLRRHYADLAPLRGHDSTSPLVFVLRYDTVALLIGLRSHMRLIRDALTAKELEQVDTLVQCTVQRGRVTNLSAPILQPTFSSPSAFAQGLNCPWHAAKSVVPELRRSRSPSRPSHIRRRTSPTSEMSPLPACRANSATPSSTSPLHSPSLPTPLQPRHRHERLPNSVDGARYSTPCACSPTTAKNACTLHVRRYRISLLQLAWLFVQGCPKTVITVRGCEADYEVVVSTLNFMVIYWRVAPTEGPWSIGRKMRHQSCLRDDYTRIMSEMTLRALQMALSMA